MKIQNQDKQGTTGESVASGTSGTQDRTLAIVASLKRKLHPRRFPNMSPFMVAVVGYVLGESFTSTQIAEITVSRRNNLVYFRKADAIGYYALRNLGGLRNDWRTLLQTAGLTGEERREAVRLLRAKIQCLG